MLEAFTPTVPPDVGKAAAAAQGLLQDTPGGPPHSDLAGNTQPPPGAAAGQGANEEGSPVQDLMLSTSTQKAQWGGPLLRLQVCCRAAAAAAALARVASRT